MGNGEEENVDIFALFLFACWIYEITLERNERTKTATIVGPLWTLHFM